MTPIPFVRRLSLRVVAVVLALVALGWWHSHLRDAVTVHTPSLEAPVATREAAPAPPPSATTDADAIDLSADEQHGGHTLSRHVGRTDAQLADRLKREPNISAASTYTDRATAERTVARTIAREQARISAWQSRQGNRPNLALDFHGAAGDVIGRSLGRRARTAVSCVDAVVVLRWDGRRYYVLTSYPEAR